ncbi:MAG TPA: glycine--tRNA ligase [Acholeplasmataceae bacterium]|nr:glycine--tRNA ligase [Acholeplasmataceae bacterium]
MTEEKKVTTMEDIVSLSKRRGFIFPGSEIYGGFANSYTYGPYGSELKNNIKKLWWKKFVQTRENIVGIDGPIILNPRIWEASGHIAGFNDALVDCKECKKRFRADHLVEDATGIDMEGQLDEMKKVLDEKKVACPACKKSNWSDVRNFNMMFKTQLNTTDGAAEEIAYLRPETAGAIFIEFKNVLDSTRQKIPFGVAQIGKAFRNEIVAGNFTFRLREFEQMEIEYFIHPEAKWEEMFEQWLKEQEEFVMSLGAKKEDIRRYEHAKEKLSHYSQKTIDIEYRFPFGFKELFGLAHRGNFDLTQHAKFSGQKLEYFDQEKNERYVPHVLEPTFGLDRSILVSLLAAYNEEDLEGGDKRIVMKFPKAIAPVKVAVFPLMKNKPELVAKAKEIFDTLKFDFMCEFDDNGNVGKRYRRQDEIGTPYCVTVDFDSLEDETVTVRDRDTMKQERIKISELQEFFAKNLK